jgi:predicted DNA-binding transcriptional regulator AlpA
MNTEETSERPNSEKPLWHLSVREFFKIQDKELFARIKGMIEDAFKEHKTEQPLIEDTISLAEASKVTGLREKSIYTKVSRLELPSITRGRPLMFSRAELQLWMRLGKPTVTEMELKRRKGDI